MKRGARPFVTATLVIAGALTVAAFATAPANKPSPTLTFFSRGVGAHARWAGMQAISLHTVRVSDYSRGYAGLLLHHVRGIPVERFLDSSFRNKTPHTEGRTLPAPRLVIEFQSAAGRFVGYGVLRQNARATGWTAVDDRTNYPNAAWEAAGGPCGLVYNVRWSTLQNCFKNDQIRAVFIVADPDGIDHLISAVTIDGTTFRGASAGASRRTDPMPAFLRAAAQVDLAG